MEDSYHHSYSMENYYKIEIKCYFYKILKDTHCLALLE